MNIKELKAKTESLANIEEITRKFGFIRQKNIDDVLRAKVILSRIAEKQIINDRLAAFAHNLASLKITTLTKDNVKGDRIIADFLSNQLNLKFIIEEIKRFDENISQLESVLSKLRMKESCTELRHVNEQQKELIKDITSNFSQLARQIKS